MEASLTIFLFATAAAFVQRISGFGFGIVIMTVLPHLMPSYGEATTLSGSLALMQSLLIVCQQWKHIRWRTLTIFLVTFLLVSYFSIQVVSLVDDHLLKQILGVILIVMSIYFLFFNGKFSLRPTLPAQVSLGACSGLMGGFCAMQGPPAVVYFLETCRSKESYLATLQAFFLFGNIGMTVFRAGCGFLTRTVMIDWCLCLVALVIGSYFGAKIFKRLSAERLRMVIYIYMLIAGIIAILS